MKLLKKLSVKTVCGDMKKWARENFLAEDSTLETQDVLRVIGIANKLETGEGDNGAWVAFKGSFKCVNLMTGEECRGGKLFLPDVASDLIETALSDENNDSVEFGFDISIMKNEKSAVGYEYSATPLLEAKEADPLAALEQSIPALEHK